MRDFEYLGVGCGRWSRVIIVLAALACGVWVFGRETGLVGNEPRFRGKSLEYWARVLTADQARRTNLLSQIGPRIVPQLLHLVKPSALCRLDVPHRLNCFALSCAPFWAREYLPVSITWEERRLNAIAMLGELGPDAKDAVPALIALLDNEYLVESGAVVLALGKIGSAAKDAVPKFIELLDEPSPEVATALGRMGPDARAALPMLQGLSTNGPLVLRRAARNAVEQIGRATGK